jgi:hypothetical protein
MSSALQSTSGLIFSSPPAPSSISRRRASGHTLTAAQARHVGVETGEVAPVGLHLAQRAAEPPLLEGFVEQVHAVAAHHRLHRLGVGEHDLHRLVVAVPHAVDEVVGRLVETPGIEHVDPRGGLDAVHHVEQHEALGVAEGAREREARMEFPDRPGKDFPGAPGVDFRGGKVEKFSLIFEGCFGHEALWGGRRTSM